MSTLLAILLFFVPGLVSSRLLRGFWDMPYAYVFSVLWLYASIMAVEAFGVRLSLLSVGLLLGLLSFILLLMLYRLSEPSRPAATVSPF